MSEKSLGELTNAKAQMKDMARVQFREQEIKKKRLVLLDELERDYILNREVLKDEFVASIAAWCKELLERQSIGEKGKIGHLTYAMLRTDLMEGRSRYLAEATDERWFIDMTVHRSFYDATWAFAYLDGWIDEMKTQMHTYAGQITLMDVGQELLREAEYVHSYVVALIRYAMPYAAQTEEFIQLDKEEVFEVRVGEYLDMSEVVYKIDTRSRENEQVKAWLNERKDTAYGYGVYSNLDLADEDYDGMDFRYSRFERSHLERSSWTDALLVGVRFEHCRLREANFVNSCIHGASFIDSDLREANFSNVQGMRGQADPQLWEMPGFEEVDFSQSNLSYAQFNESYLRGANFSGATLIGVNFTKSNLEGADFRGADLTDTDFTGALMLGAMIDEQDSEKFSESLRKNLHIFPTHQEV
ncbi:pentapeptide repeat-containing protein [Paenibacillus sp. FA6]|uniref:pentapeptide repeat-containing protein n=1 Tax=Paenibacillus sp. FA6 TaxID=3413029 RepID=UPI003F657AA1